jgi:hypothetical protein
MTQLFVTLCGVFIALLQAFTAWQNRRNGQQILLVKIAAEEAQAHAERAAKNAALAHSDLTDKVDLLLQAEGSTDGLRTIPSMGDREGNQQPLP